MNLNWRQERETPLFKTTKSKPDEDETSLPTNKNQSINC